MFYEEGDQPPTIDDELAPIIINKRLVPPITSVNLARFTDLTSALPLPSPVNKAPSSKSLLYHQKVAEESQKLLNEPSEVLVSQLVQFLQPTSSDHIQLKDNNSSSELLNDQSPNSSPLLQAILQKKPDVFKGPKHVCSKKKTIIPSTVTKNADNSSSSSTAQCADVIEDVCSNFDNLPHSRIGENVTISNDEPILQRNLCEVKENDNFSSMNQPTVPLAMDVSLGNAEYSSSLSALVDASYNFDYLSRLPPDEDAVKTYAEATLQKNPCEVKENDNFSSMNQPTVPLAMDVSLGNAEYSSSLSALVDASYNLDYLSRLPPDEDAVKTYAEATLQKNPCEVKKPNNFPSVNQLTIPPEMDLWSERSGRSSSFSSECGIAMEDLCCDFDDTSHLQTDGGLSEMDAEAIFQENTDAFEEYNYFPPENQPDNTPVKDVMLGSVKYSPNFFTPLSLNWDDSPNLERHRNFPKTKVETTLQENLSALKEFSYFPLKNQSTDSNVISILPERPQCSSGLSPQGGVVLQDRPINFDNSSHLQTDEDLIEMDAEAILQENINDLEEFNYFPSEIQSTDSPAMGILPERVQSSSSFSPQGGVVLEDRPINFDNSSHLQTDEDLIEMDAEAILQENINDLEEFRYFPSEDQPTSTSAMDILPESVGCSSSFSSQGGVVLEDQSINFDNSSHLQTDEDVIEMDAEAILQENISDLQEYNYLPSENQPTNPSAMDVLPESAGCSSSFSSQRDVVLEDPSNHLDSSSHLQTDEDVTKLDEEKILQEIACAFQEYNYLLSEIQPTSPSALEMIPRNAECSSNTSFSMMENMSCFIDNSNHSQGEENVTKTNAELRFEVAIDRLLENSEELILNIDLNDEDAIPQEVLVSKCQIEELCADAAKLKALDLMQTVPSNRLLILLKILDLNIKDASNSSLYFPFLKGGKGTQLHNEVVAERVIKAADASITVLYILTSSNMSNTLYLEDIIDRIILFTKFQLSNTIYPFFDPVYRIQKNKQKNIEISSKKAMQTCKKIVKSLYNKLHTLIGLLAELFNYQTLTDSLVLHSSSMSISLFFVEDISELQLSALKLITTIFNKYDEHRQIILEDILASISRMPSLKKNLRTYRLNSEQNIQIVTALLLQLIQSVIKLPDFLAIQKPTVGSKKEKARTVKCSESTEKEAVKVNIDRDVLIINNYEVALKLAANFLNDFLNKCSTKVMEVDYRPVFENFIQDLLTVVNKPEWPAAEVFLSLIGKILIGHLINKSGDMALRLVSLDYLGVIAARLRKDHVLSEQKLSMIDELIAEIKEQEDNENFNFSKVKNEFDNLEEDRTKFLQNILMDFLYLHGQNDSAWMAARNFYFSQWYYEAINKPKSTKKPVDSTDTTKIPEPLSDLSDKEDITSNESQESARFKLIENYKNFLLLTIQTVIDGNRSNILQGCVNYESANLISKFLASKRPFSISFDGCIKQILHVLVEQSIAIRTKAVKCLALVVEADPSILALKSIQIGVQSSFLDSSTAVREAAVDLVGKSILSQPEVIYKYYDKLSARILDTGISVRKRVIKIFGNICMQFPDFEKIPDMCVKMIRRVNDEDAVKKVVNEVFQNMWFTPVLKNSLHNQIVLHKVTNLIKVIAILIEQSLLDWFEKLLIVLFASNEVKDDAKKSKENSQKKVLIATTEIIDCLIQNVLISGEGTSNLDSQQLVSCFSTLYLFAKIKPQLLVKHALNLQPYLSLKCETQRDYLIVSNIAKILELIVPLMEHPSETFLARLEEDSVKLILQHDPVVVSSCMAFLSSVVNNVTKNFKLIQDCFKKYFSFLIKLSHQMQIGMTDEQLKAIKPHCKRALFTVGLFMRHFDFTRSEIKGDLSETLKEQVLCNFLFFIERGSHDIQIYSLKAVGSLCVLNGDLLLKTNLEQIYNHILSDSFDSLAMKIQVLNNIELYLHGEEMRMIKREQDWAKISHNENLKEMGDETSGLSGTIIQKYMKVILETFLHENVTVRRAVLKVVQNIIQQGYVHPLQVVPYLICMSTDEEKPIKYSVDNILQDIDKKYPGYINSKAKHGIKLSYKFQRNLQKCDIVRGFRQVENGSYEALNSFLYSCLRSTKQVRRSFLLSVLKNFEEDSKTSLSQILYVADNLAYFPYQTQEEPLFVIHHIEVTTSTLGNNLLETFKEHLTPIKKSKRLKYDNDEDFASLLSRIPEDTSALQECLTVAQGCLLLLAIKLHLKDLYNLSDSKIEDYSPSQIDKKFEVVLQSKSNVEFNPVRVLDNLKARISSNENGKMSKETLIDEYLHFKQEMMILDPYESEDDDDGYCYKIVNKSCELNSLNSGECSSTQGDINPSCSGASPPKIPKITIIRTALRDEDKSRRHKRYRSKKKKHSKRKRIKLESDENSD